MPLVWRASVKICAADERRRRPRRVETASQPADANTAESAPIVKMAASVDMLDQFPVRMSARFPDATARATLPPEIREADRNPTGLLPEIVASKRVQAAK